MKDTGRQFSRRQALASAGLLGGGAALAALMAAPGVAASDGAIGVEGAWLVDVTPDAGTFAPHRVLILYTKGGGVAATSDSPPTTGSTGFGAWQRTNDDRYLATFELFTFDGSGQVSGILRLRTSASLDETGDHIAGQARLDFRPNGSPSFFPAGSTHFTGSRVQALPL